MAKESYIYSTSAPDRYKILKGFARENRQKMTFAETILWEHLRSADIDAKFRRQHVIGDYIADFACLEKGLVIKVDGGYHAEPRQQGEDQMRTEWLNKMGYYVLRFTNEQVLEDIDDVLEKIETFCEQE